MPRRARVIVPGTAHHIIQRGNYQQYIFEHDKDYRTYLYLIDFYARKNGLKINAYCLMGNHVHFITTPTTSEGLSETFKNVHTRYSQYKNAQMRRIGHLWQGRFYSCVLGPTHLLRAIRYVEMNPVRARMVGRPWDYLWSSARQHMKLERHPIVTTKFHEYCEDIGLSHTNWDRYLLENDMEMVQLMRSKTHSGLAIGDDNFISKLENLLGIIMRPKKAGRPRKNR
ncbi:MAG: transposase [Candidatus Omnitrophica bacterium]|nr:transposase [Candidatus Omnitrophota bacterium]